MTEQQLEMMDDYLSNRLSAEDRSAFEQQVQADPQLAQQLNIQKDLVAGLRKARTAELKQMLNNIPVAPASGGSSMLAKVGTWTVVAGLVATGIYLFSTREEDKAPEEVTVIAEQQPEAELGVSEVPKTEPEIVPEKEEKKAPENNKQVAKKKTQVEPQPETTIPPTAKQLDVYTPEAEETDDATRKYELEQMENIKKSFVTSSIEVETDTMSKKYTFHYSFKNNKLALYGAFEKNLYEILEFIGEQKRTVVLYYKANYYLLDIEKTQPTKLSPIHDRKLLEMLKAHRGK